MNEEPAVHRTCARVQRRLPRFVEGDLPAWRRRLVQRHLDRCDACASERARQEAVAEGLRELADASPRAEPDPPDELLESILDRVHEPGVRERVAGPARGAVSGARPGLSAGAVLVTLLVVYLCWRSARAIAERFR